MFDYQAGEKYKLTLIMVGLAGLMAGMFFSVLLMPTPEAPHHRQRPAYANNADITGQAQVPSQKGTGQVAAQTQQQEQPAAAPISMADPVTSLSLVQEWLPLAWDLSAGSAKSSQEKAILYMTPECASAYRTNIWTADIAKQIDESGIKSSFSTARVSAGNNQPDGSIIISVDGEQILAVPGKSSRARQVHLDYLVKNTANGLRIAGISEGGKRS